MATNARKRGVELRLCLAVFVELFALGRDHVLAARWRRTFRCRASSACGRSPRSTLPSSFCKSRRFRLEIDQGAERQAGRRLADDDLRRRPWAPPRRWLIVADARQPLDRRLVALAGARASASLAPTRTSGAIAAGGTFISERTERMPETRSISQLISAAASASAKSGAGQAAWQSSVARVALARRLRPQLLRHERHERMQQLVDLVEHEGRAACAFGLGRLVVAHEDRLQQFEIPVAELVPDEAVGAPAASLKRYAVDAVGDLARGARQFGQDPAVDRQLRVVQARTSSLRATPFISAKRVAFQSLVPKLR